MYNFGQSSNAAPGTTPVSSAPESASLFGRGGETSDSSFSFGKSTPSTEQPSGGGLFSKNAAPSKPAGSLFGGTAATSGTLTPNAGTTLFGGSGTSASETLFGNAAKQAALSGGVFGSSSKPPSTGSGLFGQAPAAAAATTASTTPTAIGSTADPSGSMFGAASGSSATLFGNTGASKLSSGGLFPSASSALPATSATTPAKPSLSFGESTTPAGAPPTDGSEPAASSLFGGVTQGGSSKPLFGAAASGSAGSLFGQQTKTTSSALPATSTAPSILFGGVKAAECSTPLFGNQPTSTQPAAATLPAATTPAPAASTGSTLQSAAASKPSSLFGAALTSAAPATTPMASTAKGLFGGATTTTTAAPVTSSTPTTASGLFGAVATSSADPAAPSTSKPLLGAATMTATSATPAIASSVPVTATSTAPVTAGAPGATTLTKSAFASSTTGPLSQLPRLKNKTMDEIIMRWGSDLSKYQKEFKEQAEKVMEWDRMLVQNGEKIQKLFSSTYEAERESQEIERQLANLEAQQFELAANLDKYEREMDEIQTKQAMTSMDQVVGPDMERHRTYKLAEKLTDRLEEMGRDMTDMIKEINDMSGSLGKGSKPDDPLSQIVRVLNGHLSQLQWIDTNAAALQAKVVSAQKASNGTGNAYNSAENSAADSFFNSYRKT